MSNNSVITPITSFNAFFT